MPNKTTSSITTDNNNNRVSSSSWPTKLKIQIKSVWKKNNQQGNPTNERSTQLHEWMSCLCLPWAHTHTFTSTRRKGRSFNAAGKCLNSKQKKRSAPPSQVADWPLDKTRPALPCPSTFGLNPSPQSSIEFIIWPLRLQNEQSFPDEGGAASSEMKKTCLLVTPSSCHWLALKSIRNDQRHRHGHDHTHH